MELHVGVGDFGDGGEEEDDGEEEDEGCDGEVGPLDVGLVDGVSGGMGLFGGKKVRTRERGSLASTLKKAWAATMGAITDPIAWKPCAVSNLNSERRGGPQIER